MKKYIYLLVVICIPTITFFIVFNNKDKKGFYTLKKDNIVTIEKIVGKRNLSNKKIDKKNSIIKKTYTYNNVKDPYTDLSLYVSYLKEKSNFVITKDYDLNKKSGTIELSRYSIDKKYIIIMKIKYTSSSYTISITRGKGKINVLNNS